MKPPGLDIIEPELITALEAESGGRFSFLALDLASGRELAVAPDRRVPSASVYKLFVLLHVACAVHEGVAVQEGALNWHAPLTLRPEHQSPGSGVLKDLTPGLALSLHDACWLMIAVSDNSATNMVLEHVGLGAVNERLRRLGLQQTALVAQHRSPEAPRLPYATGHTTPREVTQVLSGLVQHTLAAPEVCRQVLAMLGAQQDHSVIGRRLPPGWRYAGKTGADPEVRADVGVVTAPGGRSRVLALFCHGLPPTLGWGLDHPGVLALAQLAEQLLSP